MLNKPKRIKLFIEASAIIEPTMSGIGHNIVSTLNSLVLDNNITRYYEIILLVPRGTLSELDRWKFPDTIRAKQIKLEKHLFQIIFKYGFLPPMDIFYGKGIYLFPNYKNWPLLFSKSITYIYDVAFAIYPDTIQPKNLKMLEHKVPKWIKRTDLVITISQNSKKEIIKYLKVPKNKISVVYCGVDDKEYFKSKTPAIEQIKSKYKIKNKYILFVGNIEPRKNIQRLLEAYCLLSSDIRNEYSLVLIGGGGWLNEDILANIKSLKIEGYNIIHPEEYVLDSELPGLYSGASLLTFPSIYEGFGIPPLEAMACGVPVAISNVSSLPEVVGDAGIYFNPFDVKSISRVMEKALLDKILRKKLINEGLERYKIFSWDKSANSLGQSINKIAGVIQDA